MTRDKQGAHSHGAGWPITGSGVSQVLHFTRIAFEDFDAASSAARVAAATVKDVDTRVFQG